jgi:hypothetical protein
VAPEYESCSLTRIMKLRILIRRLLLKSLPQDQVHERGARHAVPPTLMYVKWASATISSSVMEAFMRELVCCYNAAGIAKYR